MASSKLLYSLLLLYTLLSSSSLLAYCSLFTEYIGAEGLGVRFSDVPIHPAIDFHFILSFAIDYTTSRSNPTPTDGRFSVFWDAENLTASSVADIKRRHRNVKVAVSLGGASVGKSNIDVYFQPSSVDSWVENAVSSLTKIIKEYNLDGIDIDYEQFRADDDTFAECIGRLVATLKEDGVVSFVSIAPFENLQVQSHYLAFWKKYGHLVDYVNFQFYAYDKSTTVPQFLEYFEVQSSNYYGGTVLASFATDGVSGGLAPAKGFFDACRVLQGRGELHGIFIWSADDSKKNGFRLDSESQYLLASGPRA
ncbi:chitinase 2-like [Iris pallida]|uniref:Chitinase 2-like n=1 Tax=Iris pallida TaxID=29817 RepID=A0AAX6I2B9_IRIPA|nr:chitinase 2-like [Iris pallida]